MFIVLACRVAFSSRLTGQSEREKFDRLAAEEVQRHLSLPQRSPNALLMLGTFHFKDAGLDNYKPEHDIDILSQPRQHEVNEVVELLAKFRPTKIAIEVMPKHQRLMDERYKQYRAGEYELGSNEVYQPELCARKKVSTNPIAASRSTG